MTAMETRVAELLGQMTLEEKIALTIGRDFWTTSGVPRLGIEPIVMTDGPHGVRKSPQSGEIGIGNSIPATCFPTAVSLASSWDTALTAEIGHALAEECLELDVQVLLGPGVNIKRTPLGGRNFEYFSEDAVLAGEIGAAWVQGVQSLGVGTSLKHYACNNQEWERMTINVEVDPRTLREIYLSAFEQVVKKAQPWTVMAAYNKLNGTYAAENPQLLTEILKKEWSFEGVAVSDWGAVNEKPKALEAGLDLEMPGPGQNHTQKLAILVRAGTLSEAAIDDAASRVLALLLKGNANKKTKATFDREAHHTLARRAAAESIVLLKNEDQLLPLKLEQFKVKGVAVIGAFAKKPRYQGAGSSLIIPTRLDDPLEELQGWLGATVKVSYSEGYTQDEQPLENLINEAVDQARQAGVAIVFAGLPASFESEGFDRKHIFMPESHNHLIEEVCRVQPNTIVVLQNGSVVAMPWVTGPKAILEVGLGGQAVGGAIVDILSGKVNPCGKLAETFPIRLEDTPAYLNYPGEGGLVRYGEGLFVGYRYYDKKKIAPLFPFGYGLSYTTYEYTDVQTDKAEIGAGESLEVTVKLKNSGPVSGKEVVQVYIRSLNSEYARPVRELKAFAKIELKPGESGVAVIKLQERDFMVYDAERQNWRLEGGAYLIEVGGSSQEMALSVGVNIREDPRAARGIFTRMTALGRFLKDPVGREAIIEAVKGSQFEDWVQSENEMFTSMPIGKIAGLTNFSEEALAAILEEVNQADVAGKAKMEV